MFNFFKKKKTSIDAKSRLKTIVAKDNIGRGSIKDSDYITVMKSEILDVINKYIEVDESQIKMNIYKNRSNSILDIRIELSK